MYMGSALVDELQVVVRANSIYKTEHVVNDLRRGSDVPAGQCPFASAPYGGGKDILGGDSKVHRFKSGIVFIDEGNGKWWLHCSLSGTRFEQVKSPKHIFVGLVVASTEYELSVRIPVQDPLNNFTLVYGDRANFKVLLPNKDFNGPFVSQIIFQ